MKKSYYPLLALFCLNTAICGCKKNAPTEQDDKIQVDSSITIKGLDEPLDREAVEILDNASTPVPALNELTDEDGNLMFPTGKIENNKSKVLNENSKKIFN